MTAVIYARYSSDNQREESIDAQIRACTEYALQKNYNIINTYTDEARSARSDDRPGFQQMIQDSKSGAFKVVLVHKLDRFSRDRYDALHYKYKLEQNGASLESVLERIDNTPEGMILESVIQAFGEYYSRNLAREVMKGMKENARKAKFNGGIPPLGYDVTERGNYIINEKEAEAIRLIFKRYAAGHSYDAMIVELNELGYKTKLGKPFGKNSLYELLRNEKYIGKYVYNKIESRDRRGSRGRGYKDPEEIITVDGGCPSIISPELWDKCLERRKSGIKKNSGRKGKAMYKLSGKVRCGLCGASMNGKAQTNSNGNKYYYYVCSTKSNKGKDSCPSKQIPRDYLENIVIQAIYNQIASPEVISDITDFLYQKIKDMNKQVPQMLNELNKQLDENKAKVSEIITTITSGGYHSALNQVLEDLENEEKSLLKQINYEEQLRLSSKLKKEQIFTFLSQFSNIKNEDDESQRVALQTLVDRVTIGETEIEIKMLTTKKEHGSTPSEWYRRSEVTEKGHLLILMLVAYLANR